MFRRMNFKSLVGKTSLVLALSIISLGGSAIRCEDSEPRTTTPIKHVIVIFQENVSFDHYFATYPMATNPVGEPTFKARPGTPSVDGLPADLLTNNTNSANPFRLDRSQAATCDQDHGYTDEQKAYHAGLLDKFVEFAGNSGPGCNPHQVMGYFDGNTVTALWNYAQHFAMSDNHFGTVFGPSSPGALNLVSGQTSGADVSNLTTPFGQDSIASAVIGDPQPRFDDCSTREVLGMTGTNVGDLLNTAGVTWGWFQGGFRPSSVVNGTAVCGTAHTGSTGLSTKDYIPHHEPFQYYVSTANPHHLSPSAVDMIGKTDQANHQYDLIDFWSAAHSGHLPAVSFLKARAFQDGHAGYSDPVAEQAFLVDTVNRLQTLREWESTAVVIAYDDSDGWYDHVMPPIVSQSSTSLDALTGPGSCGTAAAGSLQGRCGYGPRLPLLVISPFSKENFVDHSVSDQSSILRFIEDNWGLGRIGGQSFDEKAGSLLNLFDFKGGRSDRLFLDTSTGQPSNKKSDREL
ncbi:MAG: alkaline phosphatase family protein [Acidobacteriia bacterium]|nr:alkaline phosphatase family protein [Terriglobia bacterium]